MELEKAGDTYDRPLKWVARQVLRQRYTDGVIDEILAPERVTYEDLARASSNSTSMEPPSILKAIFHQVSGNDAILAAWLVLDAHAYFSLAIGSTPCRRRTGGLVLDAHAYFSLTLRNASWPLLFSSAGSRLARPRTGGGAATTSFWIDPVEDLAVIFMTQVLPSGAYPVRRELRTMVYSAITD